MDITKAKWTAFILVFSISLFFSVFLIMSSASATSSNYDWPMFHNNPAHTGIASGSAPISKPSLVWQTGPKDDLITSPAIVNGIVYMTGYSLYAFNASTGQLIWSQAQTGSSSSAVENGIVYTAGGAFNASTGVELWKTNGEYAVAVADEYYYTSYLDLGTNNWFILSVNASTGAQIWNNTIGGRVSSIAIYGDNIYVGTAIGVSALNAYTGSMQWEYRTNVYSSLAIDGGHVYGGSQSGAFFCLDALTGNAVWTFPISHAGFVYSSPAVDNGRVYVGAENGNVYAFNASNGEKIWNYTTLNTNLGYGVESSPAVANGVVYVGADDGNLYALNATTGIKLWNYKVGNVQHLQGSPAIADGRIYIGSQDSFLMALASSSISNSTPFSSQTFEFTIVIIIIIVAAGILLINGLKPKKHSYSIS